MTLGLWSGSPARACIQGSVSVVQAGLRQLTCGQRREGCCKVLLVFQKEKRERELSAGGVEWKVSWAEEPCVKLQEAES